MTDAELEHLAALIAAALEKTAGSDRHPSWVLAPVRPELGAASKDPPAWSGAAQSLGDVAPVREPVISVHRASTAELTAAVRAAAAGRAPPAAKTPTQPVQSGRQGSRSRGFRPVEVVLGVSRRHVHLSLAHVRALFGTEELSSLRPITQPGQFAASQAVDVKGPTASLTGVRVVGPARGETQLEISRSDALLIGVDVPVAASGNLDRSVGGVTLTGPYGRVDLARGVIVAARHLHLSPADAAAWHLVDGDLVDVEGGTDSRRTQFSGVLVRSGPTHATELHLDADEAAAANLRSGDRVRIVARQSASPSKRTLITERDVLDLARNSRPVPAGALLTPSARDRARSLGIEVR